MLVDWTLTMISFGFTPWSVSCAAFVAIVLSCSSVRSGSSCIAAAKVIVGLTSGRGISRHVVASGSVAAGVGVSVSVAGVAGDASGH